MRFHLTTLTGLLLLWLVSGREAHAQSNDAVNAVVGTWEISNADHDKTCSLTLSADAAGEAYKLEVDKTCAANLPMLKGVTLWKIGPEDSVQLLDAKGRTLVEFTEVENGMYNTERPNEGVFFMQTPGSAPPPEKTADQMLGEWNMVRGTSKPICALTLSNTPANLDYVLIVKPGCDALVTRFGPTTWQMDRGELLLKSPRGLNWRFEEEDTDKWQRVPESPDPLRLVRP
jgi:hypothetical protein